MTEPSASLA
ncbi:hypothetical protein VCHFU02_2293, partial [Vibrio cholerae HFU-02]